MQIYLGICMEKVMATPRKPPNQHMSEQRRKDKKCWLLMMAVIDDDCQRGSDDLTPYPKPQV